MAKYVVTKAFKDRYSKMKIFYPGDEHTPPNEKRAKQLIDLGFIKEIEKEEEAKKATEKEKAGQKSKQKKE